MATATLRQVLGGGVDREVTARPGLSPSFGLGVSIPVRQRAAVEVEAGWTPARLEVTEDGRTRDVQAMNLIEGSLGASWSLQDGLEVGGAAGVLAYTADRTGLFAEGGTISPALRGHLGLRLPFWDGRVSLRGSAQIHRFGTAAIRLVGGSDGFVTRFQAGVRVRFR